MPTDSRIFMSFNDLAQGLTYFLAMLFALTFHEAAHAFASHLLGDDSAKSMGRLSINPAVHMDMMGTVVFPLICAVFSAPFIGWAKPVPYDERNFKHPVRDAMLTASAGPASNLLLGMACMLFVALNAKFQWSIFEAGQILSPFIKLATAMIYVNGMLAFLNLIPLPPLDGSTIMRAFVSRDFWEKYESAVAPYGFVIFLVLAYSGGLNWISSLTLAYVQILNALISPMVAAL